MMFSEEPEKFWQKYFDCLSKFHKSHDPKDLEPLKYMWLTENGQTIRFKTDGSPEEILAEIERIMLSGNPILDKRREQYKENHGQHIKEMMKLYMKNEPETYKVAIMENKAIRVIEVPDAELEDVIEYWKLLEKFYETRDMKCIKEIMREYFVDTNGDLHFPEDNPYFILINYDKLKSEIDKVSI